LHISFIKQNIRMKKFTIVICLLIGGISQLNSQTLSIGPVAGVNVSQFGGEPEAKNLLGLSLGLLANYSVNEHVGISAKLLYSQLGSKTTLNDEAYTRFHYLQLPISLVYYFNNAGDNFRPKIYAGPYFGRLLRANNEVNNRMIDGANNDVFYKRDIGGQIGVGFNYMIKPRTWLNVDLGYAKSFSDISVSDLNKIYNSAVSLNVGVSFPIGKE
jgi:outer membrane protein W